MLNLRTETKDRYTSCGKSRIRNQMQDIFAQCREFGNTFFSGIDNSPDVEQLACYYNPLKARLLVYVTGCLFACRLNVCLYAKRIWNGYL